MPIADQEILPIYDNALRIYNILRNLGSSKANTNYAKDKSTTKAINSQVKYQRNPEK